MKRKIFAALVAVIMVVTMLPLSVMADDITVTTKDQLVAAVATDNASILLGADIELDAKLTISKYITIDLNGHTISGNFYDSLGTVYVGPTGNLIIKDSSEAGTGAITSTETYAIGNYGYVTIFAGTFSSTGTYEEDSETYSYPALYNFYYNDTTYGKATIKRGNFSEIWNCGELDIIDYAKIGVLDNSGNVTLHSGSIETLIARDGKDTGGTADAEVKIFGGTITNTVANTDAEKNTIDRKSIKVFFDAGGGTFVGSSDPVTLTAGEPCPELPVVTKEGYDFKGWWIYYQNKFYAMWITAGYVLDLPANMFDDGSTEFEAVASWKKKPESTPDPEPKPEPKPEKPAPKFDMPRLNLRSIVIDTTEGGKTNVASGRCYGALGSTHRLTLTPDEGYEIGEVLVNGKPVEANKNGKISFVVKGNTYVEVEFVEIED